MENSSSIINTETGSQISCEVFTSFESLEGIQKEWDSFVESVGCEIFLTYDWCRIWWKYYGKKRELKVFVFRYEGNFVAILPLFFEKIWLGPCFVKAIKIVGSDFTISHFSIPIHPKYMKEVIKSFFEMLSQSRWDILMLWPIAGLYEYYDNLKNVCEELLWDSHVVTGESNGIQTYFLLADTLDKQLASLKKGERWDIKRSYKALCPEATSLLVNVASKDSFEYMFQSFVNMHQSYWESLGKFGHFGDWPSAREFHREVANNQLRYDRLRLFEIKCGTQSLGYEYNFKFGKRYFEFLNARTNSPELAKISVGRVVFCEEVKKALEEGVKCIDSMRGRYEHKLRLGGKLFYIKSICVIPRKISVRLRVCLFRLCARILNLCYYRIWFGRLVPKLPFKRRPLWKIWIRSRL
jgi:CelD/BcsL family acetyltransferase involved in cellulose biosynthesis